jgi:hypothetical protein
MGNLRITLRTCVVAGALVITGASSVHAQNTFTINGRLKVDGGSLDGAKLVVLKDGQKLRTLTNGLSKFSMDLEVNASYELAFEKEGFVTKRLSFDTHAPLEAVANGFTPFDFAVSLFKQYDGVNTVVFNQPVGMIRYDRNADDFDYDTDYTKSIQSAMEQVMEEVAKKQEQEKGMQDEEARRKEVQEKVLAKEAVQKAKAEAEAAKAKARDEKAAEEAARKERERVAAEARKAEVEAEARQRKAAEPAKPAEAVRARPPAPAPVRGSPPRKAVDPIPTPPAHAATNGTRTEPHSGADGRRSLAHREGAETSPVRRALPNEAAETRPPEKEQKPRLVRNEELIVEPNAVITRIELNDGTRRTEYRRVAHKRGQVFYFKDGQTCSRHVYELEALAERR